MIGEYGFFCTAAPAVLDAAHLSFGLAVVSSDAAELGATAFPDPGSEPEYPWLFWGEHIFRAQSASLSDSGREGTMQLRRHIDP